MREQKGLKMNTGPVNINPNDLEDITCDKCGSQCFQPVFLFKKLSAVLSPTGVENIIPMQLYRCADCGHINEAFLPKDVEIKSE
tara:strand:- start:39 stop:290 length:252 start_codon:yes stop_codon:yes gene_type:complete